MKKLLVAVAVALCGCSSQQRYVEGTVTAIGVYVPYDGQIFGSEVVSYVNGIKASFASNQSWQVEREHYATNSYFGMVRTVETTKTKIKVGTKNDE